MGVLLAHKQVVAEPVPLAFEEPGYEPGRHAYHPQEQTLLWRGSGTVTLKSKPEKQMQQVDKFLKKLGHRWDRILAGKGK